MRLTYWRLQDTDEPECMTVREAKQLLRKQGGYAWTEHYERDGTMFDSSPIYLTGNNSKHTYNRHL